jgi:hypothetical protein
MWTKNKARTMAPTVNRTAMSARSLSAARTPITTRMRPTADKTAPSVSKGRVGSGAMGSTMSRLSQRITAMTIAWKTNAARQLMAVVMSPPIKGPAAAPMPPIPVMIPKARALDVRLLKSSVVRM